MRAATFNTIKALTESLQVQDQQGAQHRDLNPHSEALTQIHRAKARSCFVHFDIDLPTGDEAKDAMAPKSGLTLLQIPQRAVEIVGSDAVSIIRTRGGVRVLVRPERVVSETKHWHPQLCRELGADQTGDLMVPVVGCCQGGFTPHFLK